MKKQLPAGKYVFLFDVLKRNPGGITRVMMNRANLFIQNGVDVKILVDGKNIDQLENLEHFRQRGYLHIEENNFVYWADFFGKELMDENISHKLNCFNINEIEKNGICHKENNTIIYYMQGKLIAKENITSERIRYIDFVDELGFVSQRQIIRDGYLICTTEYVRFPDGKEKKVINRFFSKNYFVFACIEKENNCEKITLFDEKNKKIIPIGLLKNFRNFFWYQYIQQVKEKDIFVFCDIIHYQDPFFDKIRYMESKNIYTIAILHNVGYRGSKIAPVTRKLLESNDCDAFITLTRQAKDDYERQFGKKDFIYCIHNPIQLPKCVKEFRYRKKRIIFLGRIAPIKRIEHIIYAFDIASKKILDMELHIIGFTDLDNVKNEYEKYIIDLAKRVGGNIYLKRFTDDIEGEYQNSMIGLFCSRSEAFLLSLAECAANGCVPIAYDIAFGPRDIIKNGETGLIVEENVESMAFAIQQLMGNESKLEWMHQNAIASACRFSVDAFYERWVNVLYDVLNKRRQSEKRRQFPEIADNIDKD